MGNMPDHQRYRIQVLGHLPESWSDWFDGLCVTQKPDGVTDITGSLADQAALFGLLWRIRDLGLPLLSVGILQIGESEHE